MDRRQASAEEIRLGARLRARRTEQGLSRQDLAEPLDLTERRIGAFERGVAPISALELRTVSGLLQCPITAFFDEVPVRFGVPASIPTPYDVLASNKDGADLAEAFAQLRTPRLRRHLAKLAQELVHQESHAATPP